MPVEPKTRGRIAARLAKAATRQLDLAVQALSPPADDRSIHQARRAFKRLRAMVRLLREPLGDEAARLNTEFRDAGRALAGSRDAAVLRDNLSRFIKSGDDMPVDQALEVHPIRPTPDTQAIARRLLEARPQLAAWEQLPLTGRRVRQAYARSHRSARRAMKQALVTEDAERWHTWRKRVKDLLYQTQVLRPKAPARRRYARLAEWLGEINDLTVLDAALAGTPHAGPARQRAAERRQRVQRRARKLGRKLLGRRAVRRVRKRGG